jgi:hypothetical protein
LWTQTAHSNIEASINLHGLNLFTAPEAPVNLQVTERTAHAIKLMWQHPYITNGRVKKFDVSVKLVSSHLRRPRQEVKMPEGVLEVQQLSRNYFYEVSESGIYIFCK